MTLKTTTLMLALLLGAAALPALAEEAAKEAPQADDKILANLGSFTMHPGGPMLFRMGTVKNAPYSAQAVNERQQNLGDGNQISQRHDSAAWYRDSAGRTRLEVRGKDGELRFVTINDPVAGAAWTLDPRKHSALKLRGHGRMRDEAGRGDARRGDARHEAGGEAVIVKRIERADGDKHAPREVRIQVPSVTAADGAPLGQALANALGDAKWKKNMVRKDLGTKAFDGVKAEGKLRSYEIPAGEIGNRNAIVVSDETWYAPDLQITVYAKHSDPRSGDTVFRLENLKREEPAAALFSVPADYTVKDASEGRQRRPD